MDLATVLGIFAGVLLIGISIAQGGGGGAFVHVPSMLIVFGGTVAATLVNFPLSDVLGVLHVVQKALFHKAPMPHEAIEQIVGLAEKMRRQGLLALDRELGTIEDGFLRKGIQLAVDGSEPDTIREILSMELSSLEDRHKRGQGIFTAMGTYAPAFGMIGTLIGLVKMLKSLDDPTQIGGGMAVALITTFYGALLANLIFLPIAGKLKTRSQEEILLKEIVLEGVVAMQAGDNPRIVQDKLTRLVPPKYRSEDEVQPTEQVEAA